MTILWQFCITLIIKKPGAKVLYLGAKNYTKYTNIKTEQEPQVPLLTKIKIDTPPKATKQGIKPAYQCFNLELDNKMFGKCNQFFRYTKFNLPKVNTN
jgi:hypothetical protein